MQECGILTRKQKALIEKERKLLEAEEEISNYQAVDGESQNEESESQNEGASGQRPFLVESFISGEKAIWMAGEDTQIYDDNEEFLRNIDEVIEEKCGISMPKYGEREREMCMDFGYFDHELEVYSDEEGVQKAISGYIY